MALLASACGAGDAPAVGDGAVTVSPDSIHVLATPDAISRVVDLQPTGDGRVWVLDSTAPFFVVLGSDGSVERRFGARGGGPEEFGGPLTLVRGAGASEVWTYDFRRSSLIRISEAERLELPLSRDSIPVSSLISFQGAGVNAAPPWIARGVEGFLLARARTSRPESALHLWNADILEVSADAGGTAVELYTPLADVLDDPAARFGDATVQLPYPIWTVCADGTVGLYDPLQNTLRHLTREGAMLQDLALPDERDVPMTPDLVFEMFYRQLQEDAPSSQIPSEAEMRRMTEEQNRQFVGGSYRSFPEYSELRCSPDGTFWLRLFDVTRGRLGRGPDWLRVSTDGSRTEVAFPEAFRPFRVEGDRIWGALRDSLGVESVGWVGTRTLR